jgi:DNA polymerase III subunit epsilon
MNQREFDRDVAILTARLITGGKYIVIDTETTGLVEPEACQIAWTLETGERGSRLVKPSKPIEAGATAIHKITNEMIEGADPLIDIIGEVVDLARDRVVVMYNAPFDTGVITRSTKKIYLSPMVQDAMLIFASFNGEWNASRGSYRWKKLGEAISIMDLDITEDLHDAEVDAFMTRALLIAISIKNTSGETQIMRELTPDPRLRDDEPDDDLPF